MRGKIFVIAFLTREYDTERTMPFVCLVDSKEEILAAINSGERPYTHEEVKEKLAPVAIPLIAKELFLDFNYETETHFFGEDH